MRRDDDGGHQRQPLRGIHFDYEGEINLQLIYRPFAQVDERGESGAEIVDGDGDAQGADRLQGGDIELDIVRSSSTSCRRPAACSSGTVIAPCPISTIASD